MNKQENNPLLVGIRNDVRIMGRVMRELAHHVLHEKISEFPMFIAHQGELALGRPFLSADMYKLNWDYRASVLEELVKNKIVEREKVEEFRETFGDPEERACIFVILPNESAFVFVPYEIAFEEEEGA